MQNSISGQSNQSNQPNKQSLPDTLFQVISDSLGEGTTWSKVLIQLTQVDVVDAGSQKDQMIFRPAQPGQDWDFYTVSLSNDDVEDMSYCLGDFQAPSMAFGFAHFVGQTLKIPVIDRTAQPEPTARKTPVAPRMTM